MQNTPFFSIVVPVYKVEDYLCQCVQSVLGQDFEDFEVILVDDGSPDRCGAICDDLAAQDSRVRVLHQENQGLSGARNSGLALARGRYVLFLDSDDFYPQGDLLRRLREACGGADVLCFNYARYTHRLLKPMIAFPADRGLTGDALWRELVRCNAYSSSACVKAVRRELLTENGIEFEPGILSEDIEWSARVMAAAGSVAMAPECLYAYRVRPGSITKTVSDRHARTQLRIVSTLARAWPRRSEDFLAAYRGYVAFQYCTVLINARICRPRLGREELAQVKAMAWLLQYDTTGIVRLIRTVYRVLGFGLTSRLLVLYFRLFCK